MDCHRWYVHAAVPVLPRWILTISLDLARFTTEQCFAYVDLNKIDTCRKALNDLNDFLESDGPFDGVLAFSQGSALAATLIVQRFLKDPLREEVNPTFKCAIFLSGGIPCHPTALEDGELSFLDVGKIGEKIAIPTANIWGSNEDQQPPTTLHGLCASDLREGLIHSGGHDIPSLSNKPAVTQAVHIIRRTIEKAHRKYGM